MAITEGQGPFSAAGPNNLCPSARTEIAIYDRPSNYLKNHKTPKKQTKFMGSDDCILRSPDIKQKPGFGPLINSQFYSLPLPTKGNASASSNKLPPPTVASNSQGTMATTSTSNMSRNGGFCGALQRAPPPMPPTLIRRLSSRECYGVGKVKVMLRVADRDRNSGGTEPDFMALDKKKRQVTLTDPRTACPPPQAAQERAPMVAAPKMFAFDNLFTGEDKQVSFNLNENLNGVHVHTWMLNQFI